MLKWKSPREYRSMTYSQSGFELKNTSGRRATLWLSKVGDVPIRYHREIPDKAVIKEVTIKKETTDEWFVCFGIEVDDEELPEKPAVNSLDTGNSVGIDLGTLKYIHTSDRTTVEWLDLECEYERLRREQCKLSRKESGSNNYEKQRVEVAKARRRIRRKVLDYHHKPSSWLVEG
jgi:putative transposase